jgi:hypothetical protein
VNGKTETGTRGGCEGKSRLEVKSPPRARIEGCGSRGTRGPMTPPHFRRLLLIPHAVRAFDKEVTTHNRFGLCERKARRIGNESGGSKEGYRGFCCPEQCPIHLCTERKSTVKATIINTTLDMYRCHTSGPQHACTLFTRWEEAPINVQQA